MIGDDLNTPAKNLQSIRVDDEEKSEDASESESSSAVTIKN